MPPHPTITIFVLLFLLLAFLASPHTTYSFQIYTLKTTSEKPDPVAANEESSTTTNQGEDEGDQRTREVKALSITTNSSSDSHNLQREQIQRPPTRRETPTFDLLRSRVATTSEALPSREQQQQTKPAARTEASRPCRASEPVFLCFNCSTRIQIDIFGFD